MLIVIAGFGHLRARLHGSLLIETIFADGPACSASSVLNRDYPVVFATLYIFPSLSRVT